MEANLGWHLMFWRIFSWILHLYSKDVIWKNALFCCLRSQSGPKKLSSGVSNKISKKRRKNENDHSSSISSKKHREKSGLSLPLFSLTKFTTTSRCLFEEENKNLTFQVEISGHVCCYFRYRVPKVIWGETRDCWRIWADQRLLRPQPQIGDAKNWCQTCWVLEHCLILLLCLYRELGSHYYGYLSVDVAFFLKANKLRVMEMWCKQAS